MISTWTLARFIACFCTIILTRDDIKTSCAPRPPKEVFLSGAVSLLTEKMHQYISKDKGSYVFSSYGLSHAMNLMWIGAEGETRNEIRKAIYKDLDDEDINGSHEVLAESNSRRNQTLQVHMATIFVVHYNVDVLLSYQKEVSTFKANYDKFFFMQRSAKDVINNYVERGTAGLIPTFLDSNYQLQPPSLLANAIAFQISWDRFDNATRQQLPFRNKGGPTKNVTMLTINGTFRFKKEKYGSILRLPYGKHYFIFIILPETPEMMTKVEKEILLQIDAEEFRMDNKYLQVTIPSFTLDTFYNLNEGIKSIGMRKAFLKGGSGLSKITKDNGFFLGEVLQRAVVDFGGGCDIPCAKPEIVEKNNLFLVDQPFFFVIRDVENFLHLFKGRVDNID